MSGCDGCIASCSVYHVSNGTGGRNSRLHVSVKPLIPQRLEKTLLKRLRGTLFVGFVVLFGSTFSYAQVSEYQVKAAMLANLALFVEWPPQAFAGEGAPFVVCVMGEDSFGRWLEVELGETFIARHPVEIRRFEEASNADGCHLLVVIRLEERWMRSVLNGIKNKPVLVVGDVDDVDNFCRMGGMIAFVVQNDKVRFDLNNKAVMRAGLKVDSRLKRVAQSVECGT